MEAILKELTNLGSSGVSQAIEGYTTWYLVSATCWLIVGFAIVVCGCLLGRLKIENWDDWDDWIRYVAVGIVIFIGVAVIIHNLSTVCASEAYAIHHFILDIKP